MHADSAAALTPKRLSTEHRIPLSFSEMARRLRLSDAPAAPIEALKRISSRRVQVEDFRPIAESLEWNLASDHWSRAGVLAFVDEQVPYTITSDGYLSECAAATLFANCEEVPAERKITVLELGAGTGLFARYFLDAFRDLCGREGRDFYDRLTYVVSDGSALTVRQWAERGIFHGHDAHIISGVCNAMEGPVFTEGGEMIEPREVRAVFTNYLLDSLPVTVVRGNGTGCDEFRIRTWLLDDETRLRKARITPEEIIRLARSSNDEDRARLLPFLSLFDFETDFFRSSTSLPYSNEAVAGLEFAQPVLVSYGAMQCVERWAGRLERGGFVLINDYGLHRDAETAKTILDRFGSTIANGLNFPLLERLLAARGFEVHAPGSDEGMPIFSRLVTRGGVAQTAESFRELFGSGRRNEVEAPAEAARCHAEEGQIEKALDCYRVALNVRPRDWRLLGEIAEFVNYRVRDGKAALDLAQTALHLNPWYSAWLWNVLGDAFFELGRTDEAHETFLQAHRMNPDNVRTNYSLSFTFFQAGRYREALEALAVVLARDGEGVYRQRAMEKQQQTLSAVAAGWNNEQSWMSQRSLSWTARLRPPQGAVPAPPANPEATNLED